MILDTLKLRSLTFQLQFGAAFELWDHAGAIGRRFAQLWPDIEIDTAEPNRVLLKGPGIAIQTQIDTAILTLRGASTMDAKSASIRSAVDIWKETLELTEIKRVSMRVQYAKEYPSAKAANAAVIALGLAKFPTERVFDQPIEGGKNALDVAFRFEDDVTFTVLRVRAEGVRVEQRLDPEFFDEPTLTKEKNHLLIDFDRGTLKPMTADKFNAEEWVKGYFHVLRRDIDKVLRSE